MMTSNQIRAYVRRYFPGLRAQPSVHGCYAGSVQIFGADGLVCDIRTRMTEWGCSSHIITRP